PGAVYQGKWWLPMAARGELWSWDGSTLRVERQLLLDQAADGYAAPISALAEYRGALWAGRWDATYKAGLERSDGGAAVWSFPVVGGPGQATAVRALAVYGDALY